MGTRYPRLTKHLLGVVKEFTEVFGIDSLTVKSRSWVESIRKDNKKAAVLPLGNQRHLILMTEEGERKLIFQTPQSLLEVKENFDRWSAMPLTSSLKRRNIFVRTSCRTMRPEEVLWGEDREGDE